MLQSTLLRRVAVHDRYQLELKLGFPLQRDQATRYRIDTYIFVPHSLGINETAYPRADFYRDIQHYVRMKTPQLRLDQLVEDARSPLQRSEMLLLENLHGMTQAVEQKLSDNLRIMRAMLKSAIHTLLAPLTSQPPASGHDRALQYEEIAGQLLELTANIESRFRALEQLFVEAGAGDELIQAYRLTDESLSILLEDNFLHTFQLAEIWLEGSQCTAWKEQLAGRVHAEVDYRTRQRYPSVLRKKTREGYLQRLSALKKFTSSVLWLSATTRREGTTLEQLLFSIAAGVSMIFATLIAFYAQAYYGPFTLPVFLALVIAYMFKDRIKEQGRAYSANLLSRRLFDYRTIIETQDGRYRLGNVREKVSHANSDAVPPSVMAARGAGRANDLEIVGNPESVIVYSKQVEIRKDAFNYLAEDGLEVSAINDIMRYDVRPFLRKMDDPYQIRQMLKGKRIVRVRCHRTYRVNLVSVFQAEDGNTACERTRMVLDRRGIVHIEQFDAHGTPTATATTAIRVSDLAEADYAA